MVLWDEGEATRGLQHTVAVLARAHSRSAKMNHLWGMRQNRPLLCMSTGGGGGCHVLSCSGICVRFPAETQQICGESA